MLASALVLLAMTSIGTVLPLATAHAQGTRFPGNSESAAQSSRGTWAALLIGYLVVGAVATSGAYVLRDNIAGRGIATTVAGWGGLGAGAVLGYGAVRLTGCDEPDCTGAAEVATAVGGVLGGAIGSLTGFWLTAEPGLSRPYTTAAGLAPMFVFLVGGTVFNW